MFRLYKPSLWPLPWPEACNTSIFPMTLPLIMVHHQTKFGYKEVHKFRRHHLHRLIEMVNLRCDLTLIKAILIFSLDTFAYGGFTIKVRPTATESLVLKILQRQSDYIRLYGDLDLEDNNPILRIRTPCHWDSSPPSPTIIATKFGINVGIMKAKYHLGT